MASSSRATYLDEARANLRLALPLIAAQVAAVGMGTVDSIFAGQLGARSLAAVSVGTNVNVLFLVFTLGLLMACSPIVAHKVGGRRSPAEILRFLQRSRRFALLIGVGWMVGLNLAAGPVLRSLHLSDETTDLSIRFVRGLSFSGIGTSLWFAQRFCAEGLGHVRPILWTGFAGLLLNALLDWLLLFGHWGFPALGAPGCGIATSIATITMAGLLALVFDREKVVREAGSLPSPEAADDEVIDSNDEIHELLRLGVPIGLIMLAEAGLFATSALLMAHFGDTAVASYQVAINFASMLFMIPLGIGLATTVRVGHASGGRDLLAARFRGRVGMAMGLLNAASNATIMATLPRAIARLYTADAVIVEQVRGFLLLAALFQFFDGLQVTANGALRGIKDARVPMLVTLVAYWVIGMPVAWLLAFRTPAGPEGLWWGMVAGLGIAAIGLSMRFSRRSAALIAVSSQKMA